MGYLKWNILFRTAKWSSIIQNVLVFPHQ